MKQHFLSVEELLEQLKLLSSEMLGLDLENEEEHGRLEELQNRQEKLRQFAGEQFHGHNHSRSPVIKKLVEECIQLEKQVGEKLILQKEVAVNHLSNLQAGKRARASYQGNTTQVDGYFFDKYK